MDLYQSVEVEGTRGLRTATAASVAASRGPHRPAQETGAFDRPNSETRRAGRWCPFRGWDGRRDAKPLVRGGEAPGPRYPDEKKRYFEAHSIPYQNHFNRLLTVMFTG